MRSHNFLDLTGKNFTRLTAISPDFSKKRVHWICKCTCGNEVLVATYNLTGGVTKSCGCLKLEIFCKKITTHGQSKRKMHTETYNTWAGMRKRCNTPSCMSYKYYGGKGIKVCDRWNNFKLFFEDMGEKPEGKYSLDRIDNNGGYSKDNCRWADAKTQCNNKRNNWMLTVDGVTQSLTSWAEHYNISPITVRSRLKLGWNTIDALSRPVDKRKATKAKLTR